MIAVWAGVIAVTSIAIGVAIALSRSAEWEQLDKERRDASGQGVDCVGGAWVNSVNASAHLVRIVFLPGRLLVFARWKWLPVPPTALDRDEIEGLRVIRRTLFGYERITVALAGSATIRRLVLWLRPADVASANRFGWNIEDRGASD
jgi:hypothetical protein